jgi:hypothetical protein
VTEPRRTGITVRMRVDRQSSTVDYPEANLANVRSNGTLALLKTREHGSSEVLGEVAKGCWTRWAWTDDSVEAQDLDS